MALPPVPFRNAITSLPKLFVTDEWLRWLTVVLTAISAAAQKVGTVGLTAQGAAIVTTAIPTPRLSAGLYRVTCYARITRAATISSSLTVTISWTDGGIACSQSFAAVAGNTTATSQSGSLLVRVDEATTISYATAYASSGATSMLYQLDVRVELVP